MPYDYLIDFNRGNDSNNGYDAPWKNLSKITSVTAAAGDNFLLANDSEFDIASRILLSSGNGWSSTVGTPIRFDKYYPLSAATTQRPIIRKRASIAGGSWTYSAPNNAWYVDMANTVSAYAYVKVAGEWATRTDNALPLDSHDGRWSNSGSRVYVYAPSGTNPTAYYGEVVIGGDSSDSPFVLSSVGGNPGVRHMEFAGWRFEEGCGIYIFNSVGTRQYRIHDMEADDVGCPFYLLTQTAGSVDLEIYDCVLRNGGTTLISAYAQGGVGISRWKVRDNDLADFNFGYPQGGIYSQVPGAEIDHNVVAGAIYGVNGKSSDGAGIYVETGADDNLVTRNVVSNSYLAFQDNSGKTTTYSGNIIEGCYAALKVTDASGHQAVDITWTHNTQIDAGTPITPNAGSVAGIGVVAFTATTPGMIFTLKNNILTKHSAAAAAYAFELPTNATGAIANNCAYGFAGMAEIYGGGTSPITPTGNTFVDPRLDSRYFPLEESIRDSGEGLGGFDYYYLPFRASPTLGAVQYEAARVEPAMPGFFYDNLLNDGVPVASSTATGFDVLNLGDLRPYSFWKPTTLPATVTIDCGVARVADFAAVYRHDLNACDCIIEIRGSEDNFSSSDELLARLEPQSDDPFVLPFDAATYRYWRISIDGVDEPTLAIVLIGEALRLPRRQVLGFDPVARSARTMTNQSAGGYPLGKVTAFEEWRQKVALDVVQWAWLRDTWLPAWREHLRDEPFLYAWDSTDHPTELYLVTSSGEFAAPTLGGDKCSFEVEISGAVP